MRMKPLRQLVAAGMTAALAASAASLLAMSQTGQTPPQTPPPQTAPAKPAAPQAPATKPILPFPADAKLAVVVMQEIALQSKIGKCSSEQMQAMRASHARDLQAKDKDIQALNNRIQGSGSLLTDQTLRQLQRDLDKLQRDKQSLAEDQQAEETNLNNDLQQAFSEKVAPVVEALRVEHNIWIIFSSGPGSSLLAWQPDVDVTGELVKRLDAKYPDPCPKK